MQVNLMNELNTVETRAILAGVATAFGVQLSGDAMVDAGIIGAFIVGGLIEMIRRIKARKAARRAARAESSEGAEGAEDAERARPADTAERGTVLLVCLGAFLAPGCAVPVVPDVQITSATISGSGQVTGTVGDVPFSLTVEAACTDDDEETCTATACVTVIGITRCQQVQ